MCSYIVLSLAVSKENEDEGTIGLKEMEAANESDDDQSEEAEEDDIDEDEENE